MEGNPAFDNAIYSYYYYYNQQCKEHTCTTSQHYSGVSPQLTVNVNIIVNEYSNYYSIINMFISVNVAA